MVEGADPMLPIELIAFHAIPRDKVVDLVWVTNSEVNNDYFTIERSQNMINIDIIGTVDGAGNSSTTLNYRLVDERPYEGYSYYRLKQTDNDGRSVYSDWVPVYMRSAEQVANEHVSALTTSDIQLVQAYPNPTTGLVNILYTCTSDKQIRYEVHDLTGRRVMYKQVSANEGVNFLQIDLARLPRGTYILLLRGNSGVAYVKVVRT